MDVNAFLEPVPRADRRIPRGSVRFSRPVSGAFTVSGPAPCVDVGRCTVPSAVRYSIISRREAVVYAQHRHRKTTAQCRLDRKAHRT